jgi:hypothetical protein
METPLMTPSLHKRAPHSAPSDVTVHYSIDAEAHVRAAARLVELDPDESAQRTAAVLYAMAGRIRGSRGEVTVRW